MLPDAGEQREKRGLADAVRADQTDHTAARNSERHVVERDVLAIDERNARKRADRLGAAVIALPSAAAKPAIRSCDRPAHRRLPGSPVRIRGDRGAQE